MPVFKSGPGLAPEWCELSWFEILTLQQGMRHTLQRTTPKARLVVVDGRCRLTHGTVTTLLVPGSPCDLDATNPQVLMIEAQTPTQLVAMYGCWGDELGGCGLFRVTPSEAPRDTGDRVGYSKTTNFDCHYHDCDEYWIVVAGTGTVVTEGKPFVVAAGDCVATGMGHHHDVPQVVEPIHAVYFETTLGGQKRLGHLWEHMHGPALPRPERV